MQCNAMHAALASSPGRGRAAGGALVHAPRQALAPSARPSAPLHASLATPPPCARSYTKWVEWNMCLDYSLLFNAPLNETEKAEYVGPEVGSTPLLHAGMHWSVGSIGNNTDGKWLQSVAGRAEPWLGARHGKLNVLCSSDQLAPPPFSPQGCPPACSHLPRCRADPGDVFDVATSPNDILIFFLHHANLDRRWVGGGSRLLSCVGARGPPRTGSGIQRTACTLRACPAPRPQSHHHCTPLPPPQRDDLADERR